MYLLGCFCRAVDIQALGDANLWREHAGVGSIQVKLLTPQLLMKLMGGLQWEDLGLRLACKAT